MTSSVPPDIAQDPLARAVLRKLAETQAKDHPLGSFARTVLSGDANLRDAARHEWHGQALGGAFADAVEAQRGLPKEERDEIERSASRLRQTIEAGDENSAAEERRTGRS